jgi:putative hydrolase of the HAD superfamily
MKNLKVIAFDADDTLFINETCWNRAKNSGLMEDYLSHQSISKELFKMEIDNLKLYGYGIKAISFPWLKQQCAFQITHFPLK